MRLAPSHKPPRRSRAAPADTHSAQFTPASSSQPGVGSTRGLLGERVLIHPPQLRPVGEPAWRTSPMSPEPCHQNEGLVRGRRAAPVQAPWACKQWYEVPAATGGTGRLGDWAIQRHGLTTSSRLWTRRLDEAALPQPGHETSGRQRPNVVGRGCFAHGKGPDTQPTPMAAIAGMRRQGCRSGRCRPFRHSQDSRSSEVQQIVDHRRPQRQVGDAVTAQVHGSRTRARRPVPRSCRAATTSRGADALGQVRPHTACLDSPPVAGRLPALIVPGCEPRSRHRQ